MNKESMQFIETMLSQNHHRDQMLRILNSDPNGAYVYYLAPYANVIGILEEGGILPRNRAKKFIDLSDKAIQDKRDRKIDYWTPDAVNLPIPIHECVNFFINPLNNTHYQFRRNALFTNNKHNFYHNLVCILEIDLEILLKQDDILIWFTQKNLAQISGWKIYLPNNIVDFNWKEIYKIENSEKKRDDLRSAEFIVYMNGLTKNNMVPKACIKNIYIYEGDLNYFVHGESPTINFNLKIISTDKKAASFGNPLEYQEKFFLSLAKISDPEKMVVFIVNALSRISVLEHELGLSLKSAFDNSIVANNSYHGIGHVIRVLFWVSILCDLFNDSNEMINNDEIKSVLYAAFFHDSCRKNDLPDPQHGERASEKYKEFLSKKLSQDLLNRCLVAIKSHSEPSDPLQTDIIWETLKDADAIDRGRYGPPNNGEGCLKEKLRLRIIRDQNPDFGFIDSLLWLGYRLPKMTNHINWSDSPCDDFVKNVVKNFKLVIKSDNLSQKQMSLVCLINKEIVNFQLSE